jgi:uncharacterized protein (TIGR02270 family)
VSVSADRTFARVVPIVLLQHVEDAAILHATRTALARAPDAKLHHLLRFDTRLDAHLDALAVAGPEASTMLEQSLELPSAGVVFTLAIRAVEERNLELLERLLAISGAMPEVRSGVASAFGWLEPSRLRGIVAELLGSQKPLARWVGVAASALHRVDPGLVEGGYLEDADPLVRARAWRAVGELGKTDLLPRVPSALDDPDATCRFWAAWAAILLGAGEGSLAVLTSVAAAPGPLRARAFDLAIRGASHSTAREWLASLAPDPANRKWLVRGCGLAGDPTYVPWLIAQMSDPEVAKVAGEAFSTITGVDLALHDMDRTPPEATASGPNDNPEDPNVELDEDDALPFPDAEKVEGWWATNSGGFEAGIRYFMGEPLNTENCVRVLKEGFQRQRIAAAQYLSILRPGAPLFEWRAPAWRQQRLLAELS